MRTLIILLMASASVCFAALKFGTNISLRSTAYVNDPPYTLSGWINVQPTTHILLNVQKNSSGSDYIEMEAATNYAAFDDRGSARGNGSYSKHFPTGTWHLFTLVCEASNRRVFYADGVAVITNTTSLTHSGLNNTHIGYQNLPPTYWSGSSSAAFGIAMWNVALTADEVLQMYSGLTPKKVRPQSLVMFLPMETTMSAQLDVVGGAVTVSNTPVFFDNPPLIYR